MNENPILNKLFTVLSKFDRDQVLEFINRDDQYEIISISEYWSRSTMVSVYYKERDR